MPDDLPLILNGYLKGDPKRASELVPALYGELRRLAAARLGREPAGQTIQPTALVHEAYARLLGPAGADEAKWNDRAHFFGAAAEAMRRILIDRARAKRAEKRGGGVAPSDWSLADLPLPVGDSPEDLLDLDGALEEFAKVEPAKAQLVRLRFYAGLTLEQAGRALGLPPATADRHWAFARAWLHKHLAEGHPSDKVPRT